MSVTKQIGWSPEDNLLADISKQMDRLIQVASTISGGGGGGSVTSFSSGNLSPLFTTSVANPTTTPALTFALSNTGANTWFGNNTGLSTTPTFSAAGSLTEATSSVLTITGSSTLLGNTSIQVKLASGSQSGYLSSSDWTTFNGKLTSPLTTKGDILTYSSTNARLGIGADATIFMADSAQTTGNKWITLSGDATIATSGAITVAATIVKTVVLNTPNVVFSTPVNFVTATNTATGTLSLNTQTANTVFAGPTSGGAVTPTFRALVTADIPALAYWALTGTSTLTGVATITSNVANQHIFNGTWTATASNQYHMNFGGTFDARSTTNDVLSGYLFNPTMNQRGNAQPIAAVRINPTLNANASTNPTLRALEVTQGHVVIGNASFSSVGDDSQLYIKNQSTATFILSTQKSDGTNTFRVLESNGGVTFGSATGYIACSDFESPLISGGGYIFYPNGFSKSDASNYASVTVTTNSNNSQTSTGSLTLLNLNNNSFTVASGTGAYNWTRMAGVINQTSTASGAITLFNLVPTYTSNKGVTSVFDYNPTETSVTGAHYFIRNRSTTALSGFGLATPSNAYIVIGAGTTTIAPFKLTSGTNLTTAVAGCFEYDGTTLFYTRTGTTRESILTSAGGASAPSTSSLTAFTNYYGSGGTIALSTPADWLSVVVNGTNRKIPVY